MAFLCQIATFSQNEVVADSISIKDRIINDLIDQIYETDSTELMEELALDYISKARQVSDSFDLITGYEIMSAIAGREMRMAYIDSIIKITIINPNKFNPAGAYLSKAGEYYSYLDYQNALDNYLLANRFAKKYPNEALIYQSSHGIGILKNRIGDYNSALQIHLNNLKFYDKNSIELPSKYYLTSMFSTTISHLRLKNIDSSSFYNKTGAKLSLKSNDDEMFNLFRLSESIVHYMNQEYKISLDSLYKSIGYLKKIDDKPNLAIAYFYLAENNFLLGKEKDALMYYKKVDTIFLETKVIDPEIRSTYNRLNDYFDELGDKEQQLIYLERLIRVDSSLNRNQKLLSSEINSKFDIPNLISKKEFLISELEKDNRGLFKIIILIVCLLVLTSIWQFYRRITLRRRFDLLMSERATPKTGTKKAIIESIEVPHEIVNSILSQLDKFEKEELFTNSSLTLSNMAQTFNTNSNYLSRSINVYKEKNFTSYLNDLRINYAFQKIKEDDSFRKYTINAIALECGFKSAETFSRIFKNKFGIYPSYLLKQLEKSPIRIVQ